MSDEFFQAPSLEYLGEHLPQYEFEEFIAQGGMGAVYKARQISLDRMVAIKVLPHELGENEEFRESFSKEAKAMAKLNHPNLIGVFDSGDVDGMPYIAMEYIEGSSLHDSCWGQVVDSAQAVSIIKGICEGLADAHEHGIIHRDIKPANILLTTKAVPKIGDFGLAHPSDSEESGLVMGTPGYTAPEIFVDPDQAGVLADQYSVGMILHQLLTGIDPVGTQGPPTELTGKIRLDAIWRRATQLNPAERYPSMAEMAADLKKWENVKTGVPVTGGALGAGVPKIAPATLLPKKSGGGGILVKLVILCALGAAAWYGFGKFQEDKNPGSNELTGPGSQEDPILPESPSPAPNPQLPNRNHTPSRPSDPTPPESGEVVTTPRQKPVERPAIPSPQLPDPSPSTPAKVELPPGDPVLRDKAIALILDGRQKRDALLSKNTLAFQRVLEAEAASAARSDARRYDRLRRKCESGWIPEPDDLPRVNDRISRAYSVAHRDQTSIESKYLIELTRIRDFYVPILQKAADATSDSEQKERLLAQVQRASDVSVWAITLAPEAHRNAIHMERPEEDAAPIRDANAGADFVGKWDVVSDKNSQWLTDKNGGIQVVDKTWTGQWKILDDGSLEVSFGGKKPYSLTRNGNGWSGVTGFGRPIQVTPVD